MPSQAQKPPTGITVEDWEATPPTVQALVVSLLERLAQVEARLNQTSRNSSKPPSSDSPNAPRRLAKESSGRKPGGQPGHQGQGRRLKPVEDVDRVIEVRPERCAQCGTLLLGEDPDPERHQVVVLSW
jgi:transposase